MAVKKNNAKNNSKPNKNKNNSVKNNSVKNNSVKNNSVKNKKPVSVKNANNNSNNTNTLNASTATNFNRLVNKMTKTAVFENKKAKNRSSTALYKTNSNYQSSFSNILAFEKTHHNDKTNIDVIIYHGSNNDGLLSAYIAWKFLVKDNGKKDVMIYSFKPGHSANRIDNTIERNLDRFRGKNVIILDLSYTPITLDAIKNVAKLLLVIDDHKDITQPSANIFVGDNKHAACAYTWKFFYPSINVPKVVQYIDDSDRKLMLPFLSHSNLFALSFGFRYGHSLMQSSMNSLFEKLDILFESDNPNFWVLIGKYFDEMLENLKNQISINSRKIRFLDKYEVGILNFGSPALLKPVGRQIITNFKNRGDHIDFVLLWDYQYSLTPPAFSITLMEDHSNKTPKYDLPNLARKISKKYPHLKGFGGSKFLAHLYFTGNIFDLFNGKIKYSDL